MAIYSLTDCLNHLAGGAKARPSLMTLSELRKAVEPLAAKLPEAAHILDRCDFRNYRTLRTPSWGTRAQATLEELDRQLQTVAERREPLASVNDTPIFTTQDLDIVCEAFLKIFADFRGYYTAAISSKNKRR